MVESWISDCRKLRNVNAAKIPAAGSSRAYPRSRDAEQACAQ
jgi:hypothetical protein